MRAGTVLTCGHVHPSQPVTDAELRSEDRPMNVCVSGRSHPNSQQHGHEHTREAVDGPDIFAEMGVLPDEPA